MMESVKKAFILSAKALNLFYVVAAVNVIMNIINFLVVPAPAKSEMSIGKSALVIILTVVFALISLFVTAGAFTYIKGLIKSGSAKLSSLIEGGSKYFLKLLLVSLILLAAFFVLSIAMAAVLKILPVTLNVLKLIITVLLFIILAVIVIMSPYAVVAGDLSVKEAIKSSIAMGLKHFLKIIGIMLIMIGVGIVILVIAGVLSGLLSFILRPLAGLLAAVIMAIASSIIGIFVNIAYMDFYMKNASTTR